MSRQYECESWVRGARIYLLRLILVMVVATLPALAALGGDASTVQADQLHMQGSLRTTNAEAYTVHEIQSPSGITVREYVSPGGKIFAVAWRGPWMPDMRQLLGDYFHQYADAVQAQADKRRGRRPLEIVQPGFVLHQFGHMRSFAGSAYIPEMVPQNVGVEAIQ